MSIATEWSHPPSGVQMIAWQATRRAGLQGSEEVEHWTWEGLIAGGTLGFALGVVVGWAWSWWSADREIDSVAADWQRELTKEQEKMSHWRKVATERREVLVRIRQLAGGCDERDCNG